MLAGNSIIKKALVDGHWTAHRDGAQIGFDDLKVGPHSIDVSLAGVFLVPTPMVVASGSLEDYLRETILDPYDDQQKEVAYLKRTAAFYDLRPGEFILSCVRERFDCSKPVAFRYERHQAGPLVMGGITPMSINTTLERCTQHYDGRSTMGRLGIISHATAGYGDLGFASNFTLEITNLNPNFTVRLHRGMRIGQVSFHAVANTGDIVEYQGSYTQQHDVPVAPRLGAAKFLQPGEGFDPATIYRAKPT